MSIDHYADGEKDGARGEYKPPHNITPLDSLFHNDHTLKEMEEDNKQYDAGYKNTRKQKIATCEDTRGS